MATIDEFALKNIGLWWRYGISRHCDEWKYIIMWRIFESEIILIPPSLKISESSSNGSYRNTDEVWWRYGVATSAHVSFVFTILLLTCSFEEKYVNMNLICLHNIVFKLSKNLKIIFYNTPLMSLKSEKKSTKQ